MSGAMSEAEAKAKAAEISRWVREGIARDRATEAEEARRKAAEAEARRPRVVVDDDRIVEEAVVVVSPRDPNYRRRDNGVVTVLVDLAQRRWEAEQAEREAERRHMRAIDPYGWGHWGPHGGSRD